jgi:hypothetical protein
MHHSHDPLAGGGSATELGVGFLPSLELTVLSQGFGLRGAQTPQEEERTAPIRDLEEWTGINLQQESIHA